ncbi:MAG: hypothetical protein J2P58_10220, partial [Acidimicrobiaceae bacterium]|nr:hypothetical protein [Acidimicrobiaceae bacterium]
RGVPAGNGHGDLLVTVEVAVPSKLNDAERGAVQALSEMLPGESLRARLLNGAVSSDRTTAAAGGGGQ